MSNDVLKQVETFARDAHRGQKRKYNDDPYIVHPVRVMQLCSKYTRDVPMLAAALLHDVLEDTAVTEEEMLHFLLTIMPEAEAKRTLQLVIELTDVYVKADYPKLNRRARKAKELERLATTSAGSQTVKYADIIDNGTEIVKQDADFAKVYLAECSTLLKKLNAGNKELYAEAVRVTQAGIDKLK
ncbi:MAG: HD domain-containing protein [Bacteroidetes bacterium]|nr:HD domain-containing protein [Bacteroidota bacterium]